LHKRLDPGASGGFNGWFAVLGGSHSFEVTPEFSVSVPVSVGFALGDFHTTQDGYGFASLGLQGSYAVNEQVSINGGVTYWDTDAGVTGNADNGFFAYNLGVAFSF
ncbi:MAG: hypothetical protein HKO57_00755, partial [Akkermansiaceae bacterium]|nr:hypothetical protein [Akkermansiaceae bacterium]